MLIRLQTSCLKVVTSAKWNKHWKLLLKISSQCLPLQKIFNCLFTQSFHIVEDIFLVNDSVNCLFVVCKLFVWILLRLFTRYYPCWCCNALFVRWLMLFYKVKRLFARYWSCWYVLMHCLQNDWCCWDCLQRYISANDVYILLIGWWDCQMWFINCKEVVEMFVNNE